MTTISVTKTLDVEECGTCGIVYAMTQDFMAARQRDGAWWCCPNGHRWEYTETEVSRLRKENQVLRQQKNAIVLERNRLADDLMDKAKELKRVRKRIGNGTCPHCNRHFQDVEKHMLTKHTNKMVKE